MKKAILFLAIFLPLFASAQNNISGSGTEADPYIIATADDLCNVYKLVDGLGGDIWFKQTADIDMAGYNDWHAISGHNGNYSSIIHYDGKNHIIKNFSPNNVPFSQIVETDYYYCTSLFGVVSGEISNLGVIDAYCETDHGAGILGGYAGHAVGCPLILENVFVTGTVIGTANFTGGMFGSTGNEVTMTNCFANVTVVGENNTAGLIGRVRNQVNLERVYVAGSVQGNQPYLVLGSDRDRDYNGYQVIAFNSGATASMPDGLNILDEPVFIASPTDEDAINEVKSWKGYSDTETILGLPALSPFTETTTNPPTRTSDGSLVNPYIIASPADLCNAHTLMVQGKTIYFRQTADIDMSGVTDYNEISDFETKAIYYDGGNHVIKNFSSSGSDPNSIFGYFSGTIKNLGIIDANVEATGFSFNQDIGILAKKAYTSSATNVIDNVFVQGDLAVLDDSSYWIGPMFGYADGPVSITNSYTQVEFYTSRNNKSAGLLGYAADSLNIENTYVATTSTSIDALIAYANASELTVNNVVAFGSGYAFGIKDTTTGEFDFNDNANSSVTVVPYRDSSGISIVQSWQEFNEKKFFNSHPALNWQSDEYIDHYYLFDKVDPAADSNFYQSEMLPSTIESYWKNIDSPVVVHKNAVLRNERNDSIIGLTITQSPSDFSLLNIQSPIPFDLIKIPVGTYSIIIPKNAFSDSNGIWVNEEVSWTYAIVENPIYRFESANPASGTTFNQSEGIPNIVQTYWQDIDNTIVVHKNAVLRNEKNDSIVGMTLTQNANNPSLIAVRFSLPIGSIKITTGTYTLHIPKGSFSDENGAVTNEEVNLTYNIIEQPNNETPTNFTIKTVWMNGVVDGVANPIPGLDTSWTKPVPGNSGTSTCSRFAVGKDGKILTTNHKENSIVAWDGQNLSTFKSLPTVTDNKWNGTCITSDDAGNIVLNYNFTDVDNSLIYWSVIDKDGNLTDISLSTPIENLEPHGRLDIMGHIIGDVNSPEGGIGYATTRDLGPLRVFMFHFKGDGSKVTSVTAKSSMDLSDLTIDSNSSGAAIPSPKYQTVSETLASSHPENEFYLPYGTMNPSSDHSIAKGLLATVENNTISSLSGFGNRFYLASTVFSLDGKKYIVREYVDESQMDTEIFTTWRAVMTIGVFDLETGQCVASWMDSQYSNPYGMATLTVEPIDEHSVNIYTWASTGTYDSATETQPGCYAAMLRLTDGYVEPIYRFDSANPASGSVFTELESLPTRIETRWQDVNESVVIRRNAVLRSESNDSIAAMYMTQSPTDFSLITLQSFTSFDLSVIPAGSYTVHIPKGTFSDEANIWSNEEVNLQYIIVQADKLATPVINYNGRDIMILAEEGSQIFYSIDDSGFNPYFGSFDVERLISVKAYATKAEYWDSDLAIYDVTSYGSDYYAEIGEGGSLEDAYQWADSLTREQILSNPNLLVYATNSAAAAGLNGKATNIVIGDKADVVRLSDAGAWHCPREFEAASVSFSRDFSKQTAIDGGCAGWETIALPFDVQTIMDEKGNIYPFAANADPDAHRFWLYAPDSYEWQPASAIEANVPYLIAMPNNPVYYEPFNISGKVIFSATNVNIPAPPDNLSYDFRNGYQLTANYLYLEADSQRLVVNDQAVDGNEPGSCFVADTRAVRPFEAYLTAPGQSRVPIFNTTSLTDGLMPEMALRVGCDTPQSVSIFAPCDAIIPVFDISGRAVRTVKIAAGETLRITDLPAGLYIIAKTKIAILR